MLQAHQGFFHGWTTTTIISPLNNALVIISSFVQPSFFLLFSCILVVILVLVRLLFQGGIITGQLVCVCVAFVGVLTVIILKTLLKRTGKTRGICEKRICCCWCTNSYSSSPAPSVSNSIFLLCCCQDGALCFFVQLMFS
jgi:hypothetical protein